MAHRSSPVRGASLPAVRGYSSLMKNLAGLAPSLLVSLVLLACGGFGHVEARRAEMAATLCLRAMEAVRATQVLATRWGAEVERVRSAVDGNFDRLADFSGRVNHQVRIIRDSRSAIPDLPAETDKALNSLMRRLMAQEERIERFKSGFAIVRNSRRFVPRIAEQLAEAARDGGYGRVGAATRRILEAVQGFLEQSTGSSRQRMEQATHLLAESAGSTPLRAQAEALNKHVQVLLRHHRLTEQRFEEILRTDLEDQATRAVDLLNADHRWSEKKRRYFDYGSWMALGLAVFYWCILGVRWMDRRGKGRAAARAPKAILVEGAPSPWGMNVAPVAAGGDPRRKAPGERMRLKAEEKTRILPAQPPEPLPEDARPPRPMTAPPSWTAQPSEPLSEDAREKKAAAGRDASTAPVVRKDPGKLGSSVQDSLRKVMGIDGAIGAALMDVNNGLTLATAGDGVALDVEAASANNLDVVRAEINVMKRLGLDDSIEDILITLGGQYHLIRPLGRSSVGLFLFVALDRVRGNLGMARHQLKRIEAGRFGILPT